MVNGRIVEYDQLLHKLPEIDIVITSSGAAGYILRKEDMRRVIEARKNRPMFLIDIAVPRNVEPSVNEIESIFLYDIDDLQKIVDKNLRGRMDEAAEADKIVAEEVERLESHLKTRQVVPVIVSLQDRLEQVRAAELERVRGKLGTLTSQQEEALEALTRGIINKIAHGPIAELRKHAGSDAGLTITEAVQRIFRLQDK
jgi:glutamyl-tRNA reductase